MHAEYTEIPSLASDSGFAVVARHASLGFTAVTNPSLHRSFRFEEIWIFGEPSDETERDLWKAVAPVILWIPEDKVHRISNAHDRQSLTYQISYLEKALADDQRYLAGALLLLSESGIQVGSKELIAAAERAEIKHNTEAQPNG
ncbi:MAG: hypothetical protein QM680_01020 [Luteolibacter sp.]